MASIFAVVATFQALACSHNAKMAIAFLQLLLVMVVVAVALLPQCYGWGLSKRIQLSHRKISLNMELFEGNPVGKFIWNQVWKLPIMKLGEPGTSPTTFGDNANVLKGTL